MEEKKKGFFSRLVEGLTKTRENIVSGMDSIFSGFSAIDDDFYEELEETLIMGDMGIQTTMAVIEDLKKTVKEQHIKEPEKCREALIASIRAKMDLGENAYEFENRKSVVLVIGVNGVGKTTSIGKLADQLKAEGKKVVLAAADTFRAAAIDQLAEWANRAGVELIAQKEGSDPAAVIYDAISATKSRNADVLICDTAGRLHNKKNLMEELKSIRSTRKLTVRHSLFSTERQDRTLWSRPASSWKLPTLRASSSQSSTGPQKAVSRLQSSRNLGSRSNMSVSGRRSTTFRNLIPKTS